MNYFSTLITLLRDRPVFLEEVRNGTKLESKIVSLIVASSLFFAIYGAIVGASSGWQQMLLSTVKLPALYLLTLLICLPTLYFFDILFGSQANFKQYTVLSLTTVSVISVLLFSFAPITLFFLISIRDYHFFLLLNVSIFALTGFVGVQLFYRGVKTVMKFDEKTPQIRQRLLLFWLVLYGLVGSQLGWTLRPFFGAPGEPFQLFRPIESNFYAQVIRSLISLLGGN
ncbi:actin-binding WH2 domain-containing protein [Oscillatoria sp. CS-180]|uniref:actin-binding WH2 domain-containing protein n=1 Tax=Oscillatoria sp. CS-180 TaxID=3021720 RepID=UPI00232B86F3|nr:actin-binding WH2 domain-containing protein [Oscillatoria sp. CS-180]MDB9527042.1 actin-binding WH2 domain-containing protein [Oscillatoria sp. CS-180]